MKRRIARLTGLALSVAMLAGTALPALASEASSGQTADGLAKDGSYTVLAQDRNGDVEVTTTITGGVISSVEVGAHIETSVYTDRAIPAVIAEIVEYNSYAVDAVSGATATTSAVKWGVAEALEQAGADLANYEAKPEAVKGEDETVEADVVVIGAGLSGIMAAVNAAEGGAKVAILEKTTIVGGCSLQSFATSAFGTKAAVEAGEDTDALILDKFNAWMEKEQYRADAGLLNAYLKNAGRTVDYLAETGFLVPMGTEGSHFLMPYDERKPLLEKMLDERVTANGGSVYMETTAKSLIYEDGAVTGVMAERKDGSTLTLNAKSVVIATGGYGGDAKMVLETSGVQAEIGCLYQTQGEGIKMAWEIGARVPANLGGLQLHQTLATSNIKGFDYFHTRMPMIMCYLPSLLRVTDKGVRYFNEGMINNAVAASNSAAFTGGYTYALVSQSTLDKLEEGGIAAIGADASPGMPPEYKPAFELDTPWTDTKAVFDAMVDGGWGYYGETIEELAAEAGFDPATFAAEFEAYQGYAQNGKDEFFNKDPKYLVEYEYGPYYLIESTYNQLGTVTGLVVNAGLQVLDADDDPIPGLYSCGADAASTLYNNMYTGMGDAIGWTMTSGKLSGENAAAFAVGPAE